MNQDKKNMLPVGMLLRGGTYRVTRQLKSGGFGNTYVVENVHFCEMYAMKEFFMQGVTTRSGTMVSVSLEDNVKAFTEQKEKFKKEAQRIRKLNHPNIVKIYDLFEDNGTYYYVMDYIDGESLADRLESRGAMPEVEAMDVLKKVLDALQAVHATGFTHMDITPRNIMQDRRGNVFLIDFGASKQIASSEQKSLSHTAMTYSKGYAPTEQVDKEFDKLGPWTDFYALGATLYHLLTLQSPPSSSEIISHVYHHGADPFNLPHTISSSTQSLIHWMMQPAINARPQSVDEVKKRLTKSKEDEPLSSKIEVTVFDAQSEYKNIKVLDPVIENLIANMVYVEGGTFTMGASAEQGSDADGDEKPAHQVTLSSFSIGKYEVTQEEWEKVMGSNPSCFKGSKRPVENVSWDECQEFIRKLNQLTGRKFRLPTEAEWEYAARGGVPVKEKRFGQFDFVSRNGRSFKYAGSCNIDEVAWYYRNSGYETHPVGQKKPNVIGLYDMSGNVYEWCQDWCGSYNDVVQTNPKGPAGGSDRVCRGGSWSSEARYCRVAYRNRLTPTGTNNILGFRLAL